MGRIITTEKVTYEKIIGFKCNKCHREFFNDLDCQEMVLFGDTGGYSCAFGDGVDYEICLCTKCAHEILGPYTEYKNR
jgi:hypothetical protein